jgi:hypothetical protein
MRSVLIFVLTLAIGSVVFATGFKDEVAGKWNLTVDAPGDAVQVQLDLKQDGENVTGTMASTHGSGTITKGTFKEKKLNATINADIQGSPTELGVEGTVDGDKISGTITAAGLGSFSYTGSRAK